MLGFALKRRSVGVGVVVGGGTVHLHVEEPPLVVFLGLDEGRHGMHEGGPGHQVRASTGRELEIHAGLGRGRGMGGWSRFHYGTGCGLVMNQTGNGITRKKYSKNSK